ncbi:MAG: hypothetical protein MRY78_00055 [Saprospiraceae bacterium]|nr:hypothetical protein [Saprospiraceae bacterium]
MQWKWNEVRMVERYLRKQLSPRVMQWFQAKQLQDSDFAQSIKWQAQVYRLVKFAARQDLRKEINKAEKAYFSE